MSKEYSFPLYWPWCPDTVRCGITRLPVSCCLLFTVIPTVGSRMFYNLFIHNLALRKKHRLIFKTQIALPLLVIGDFMIISVGNCIILSPVINGIVPALPCTEE